MSWDLFVQEYGPYKSLDEIPDDYQPHSLGTRDEIIQKIKEVVPFADFSDKSWGLIDTAAFSIELNMGNEEIIHSFAFHVRGGEEAIGCIRAILTHLGMKATDGSTPDFFSMEESAKQMKKWIEYRDQILNGNKLPLVACLAT